MKKLLIAFVAVMASVATFAQSEVIFNNRTSAGDAPVTKSTDGTGAGAGFTAQLVLVAANGSLTLLTPTTTFRTSSAAASVFVNASQVPIPGSSGNGGEVVTLRMRAYNGTTWENSLVRGESANFNVTLASSQLPPVDLSGLQAFQVRPVPEPATLALGALGLGALLIRRRK